MKKVFTILAAVLLTASVFAQSPQKLSYQAVIRNSSDVLVTNTQIGMEINIRQGSVSGTVVYTEIQTPTTNTNGLVSIEIGGGTGFNAIDWSAGPYFIETKTALVPPLTTYTITGTSQLLSVPYALHAKTAESVSGGITETDPVFGVSVASGITGTDTTNWNNKLDSYTETDPVFGVSVASGITGTDTTNWNNKLDIETDPVYTVSQAANITTTDITNLSNLSGVNTGDQDGSETKVTAGTNVTVTGSGTTISPYVVGATVLTIGQSYQGGIIFWLDLSGQHGLIAATADQSTGIRWYNGTNRYTGTTGDGLYAGAMNTAMIVATQMVDAQTENFAAKVCADYSVTVGGVTYGDWYLPSKYELYLLYLQNTVVGGFASGAYYWSSTESNDLMAWLHFFDNNYQGAQFKDNAYYVRAIRAF